MFEFIKNIFGTKVSELTMIEVFVNICKNKTQDDILKFYKSNKPKDIEYAKEYLEFLNQALELIEQEPNYKFQEKIIKNKLFLMKIINKYRNEVNKLNNNNEYIKSKMNSILNGIDF